MSDPLSPRAERIGQSIDALLNMPRIYNPAHERAETSRLLRSIAGPQHHAALQEWARSNPRDALELLATHGAAIPDAREIAVAAARTHHYAAIRFFENAEDNPYRHAVLQVAYPRLLDRAQDQQGFGRLERMGLATVLSSGMDGAPLKALLREVVLRELPNQAGFSAFLMRRAVTDDQSPITERDLAEHFPGYVQALQQALLRENLDEMPPGSRRTFELRTNTENQERDPRLFDMWQGLGTVTIQRNPDGSFVLLDYFDFERPRDGYGTIPNTPRDLLLAALAEPGTDKRNAIIGYVFAQEGPNETPTSSSVPIHIRIPNASSHDR